MTTSSSTRPFGASGASSGSLFSRIHTTGYALAFFGAGVALNLTGFNATLGGMQAETTILGMRMTLAVSTADSGP